MSGSSGNKDKDEDVSLVDFGVFIPDASNQPDLTVSDITPSDAQPDGLSGDADTFSSDIDAQDVFTPGGTTCADFCQTYNQLCSDSSVTGVIAAYGSTENCIAVCEGAGWDPGTLEDT